MTMLTISKIAQKFGVAEHQADYAARSRGIKPADRVGIIRLFDEAAIQKIGEVIATNAEKRGSVTHVR